MAGIGSDLLSLQVVQPYICLELYISDYMICKRKSAVLI